MNLDALAHHLPPDLETVLIDGRSGAGKSTLADELQRRWEASAVVRLDDIYPGWDGLAWAIEHLRTELLQPRAAGRPGRWRRWDWAADAPAGWQTVPAARRLIVEGVGALAARTPGNAVGIWVDAADAVRKQRALQRDGDTFRPYWEHWAAQEDAVIARYDPRSAADYLATESGDAWNWTFRAI